MPDRERLWPLRWWRTGVVLSGLLWLSLSSCAHSEATSVKRRIVFQPGPGTNSGRPVYVLVRTVNENEFLTDSYRRISGLVYPNSGDPSVLKVLLVWPNRAQNVEVEVPKEKSVGIYCIFTKPGDQWKLLLTEPMKPEYTAVLQDSTISIRSTGTAKDGDP